MIEHVLLIDILTIHIHIYRENPPLAISGEFQGLCACSGRELFLSALSSKIVFVHRTRTYDILVFSEMQGILSCAYMYMHQCQNVERYFLWWINHPLLIDLKIDIGGVMTFCRRNWLSENIFLQASSVFMDIVTKLQLVLVTLTDHVTLWWMILSK